MSITLMTLTWQTALPINHKAALLAMSDWANDEGASLHPSIYAIAERLTCSERTAQRLLKDLIEDRWLAVVGNLNGGKPGTTRHYRINVRKLREHAAMEDKRRIAERAARVKSTPEDALPNPFETGDNLTPVGTGDNLSRVTNQVETGDKSGRGGVTNQVETGDKSGRGGVTNQVETGDTGVTLPTMNPSEEPPRIHHIPDAPSAPPAELVLENPAPPKKQKADDTQDTALQIACKATWSAYSGEYASKYGAAPVRNAKVNSNVKAFVQRIGHDEAPGVAAFFVSRVSDVFVVRKMHEFGLLLASAESYRTQWATNQSMTATRASQIDKTQSNFDAAGEAMAILRAKREMSNAG